MPTLLMIVMVGNNIIMANCATLAGHVEVADSVIFAGLCAVHQFCKIGKVCFHKRAYGGSERRTSFYDCSG